MVSATIARSEFNGYHEEPMQQNTPSKATEGPLLNGITKSEANNIDGHSDIPELYRNGVHETAQVARPDQYAIPFNNQLALTPRKLKVITIGAGFSGLLMAHKFQHRFPEMQDIIEHTIFEARHEVGGSWLVNTYPGVQCDVPAHLYAFPFDPNPEWDTVYARGEHIQEYIVRTTKKWNLDRDIQFNSRVVEARWLTEPGQWKITVETEGVRREVLADIMISAQGVLVHHQYPDIKGLSDFKGHLTHSADWDSTYDYSSKKIAVIGNGSSGIQIVPQMVKLPGTEVTNFIRGPTYIYYRVSPSKQLGRDTESLNPEYTEEEKTNWRQNPGAHHEYRKLIANRTNKAFKLFVKDSQFNNDVTAHARQQMAEALGHDAELCKKLIPTWPLGCRRVTPGPGYLESFRRPNCHLTDSPIIQVTASGILTADQIHHDVDVIACATGFDVSHRPQYPLIGQEGIDLREKWRDDPESYMSILTSSFPNYFMMLGPNAVVGHGSLIEGLNWTGDYIVKWIRKISREDIKSVVPKKSVVDAFVSYSDQIHDTLVWTDGCRSWYKGGKIDGRVTALFAGSALLYKSLIGDIRGEDFDIEYNSPNRFRFLGNGFTEYEMDEGNDLAWYMEK